jgi:hypothetical protein
LDWLDKEHIGYGPHAFTQYKFFIYPGRVKAKRIFSIESTNDDPRETNIDSEIPHTTSSEVDKKELSGVSTESIPKSAELQAEEVRRYFGGDYEEESLGLLGLSQSEAENLTKLLASANKTDDPYFEGIN